MSPVAPPKEGAFNSSRTPRQHAGILKAGHDSAKAENHFLAAAQCYLSPRVCRGLERRKSPPRLPDIPLASNLHRTETGTSFSNERTDLGASLPLSPRPTMETANGFYKTLPAGNTAGNISKLPAVGMHGRPESMSLVNFLKVSGAHNFRQTDGQRVTSTRGHGYPDAHPHVHSTAAGLKLDLPFIDQICRASFQALVDGQRDKEIALASQRRELDLAARHHSRQRAAAYRRSQQRKAKALKERSESAEHCEAQSEEDQIQVDEVLEVCVEASPRLNRYSIRFAEINGSTPLLSQNVGQGIRRSGVNFIDNGKVNSQPPGFVKEASIKLPRKSDAKRRQSILQKLHTEEMQDALQALTEKEQQSLEEIFALQDVEQKGRLDCHEVMRVIWEFGVFGLNPFERRHLAKKAKAIFFRYPAGLCCKEVATKVLPKVRAALFLCRQAILRHLFRDIPKDLAGRRSVPRVLEAAKLALPHEFMDVDLHEDEELSALWSGVQKIAEQLKGSEEEQLIELTSKLQRIAEEYRRGLARRRREVQQEHYVDEETFNAFHSQILQLDKLFRKVDEDQSGELEAPEVELLFKELGVVPQTLLEKRKVLSLLSEATSFDFCDFLKLVSQIRDLYASQNDECLQRSFAHHALEYACSGKSIARRAKHKLQLRNLAHSLEHSDGSFEKKMIEDQMVEQMQLQADDEGHLVIATPQLLQMLCEVSLIPNEMISDYAQQQHYIAASQKPAPSQLLEDQPPTVQTESVRRRRHRQSDQTMSLALAKASLDEILQDIDPYGRELFTYVQVRIIILRMRELSRQCSQRVEEKEIKKLGISGSELKDLKALFAELDVRKTGLIGEAELGVAFQALQIKLQREAVRRIAFRYFDFDGNGNLDLFEFLKLFRTAQREEGPFKNLERTVVFTLGDMEDRKSVV